MQAFLRAGSTRVPLTVHKFVLGSVFCVQNRNVLGGGEVKAIISTGLPDLRFAQKVAQPKHPAVVSFSLYIRFYKASRVLVKQT